MIDEERVVHAGEVAVQRRAGVRAPNMGSARVGADIPPVAADFLSLLPFVVVGAADADGDLWATALYGWPGFAVAEDERTVVVDAVPGPDDPLAWLVDGEHELGMIAIEPQTRRRMRVNGTGSYVDGKLRLRTAQVYSNCPKYIQARRFTGLFEERGVLASSGPALTRDQAALVTGADTFYIATAAPGLGADVSHRGGAPGFVSTVDGKRLSFPDYQGNAMFMTLGNLELDPRCGLLFWDHAGGRALHVTGKAAVDWDPARAAAVPGAKRMVDVEVTRVVEIDGGQRLRWEFEEYSPHNPPVR